MEASVTDPSGTTELCEIMDEDDFHYRLNFTPHKEGLHTLSIKHKALHISGNFLFKSRPCKLLNMFCMQSFWKFSDDLVSFSFFPYFIELFFNVHVKLPTYFIIRSINRVVQNALCFFSYYLTKTLLGLQYTK